MSTKKELISSLISIEEQQHPVYLDQTRRNFLKVLLSTGFGAFFLLLFNRKANALTFGQSGYIKPTYLTKIDAVSTLVTYVGNAAIGSDDADSSWQIKKISVSGTVTSIEWADSNDSFDNVWSNRESLEYS